MRSIDTMILIHILLWMVAVMVAAPVLMFVFEVLLSLSGRDGNNEAAVDFNGDNPNDLRQYVVIVPAHNEESELPMTLAHLYNEVANPRDILVVADNCKDNTADIARRAGVSVLERFDVDHRGKGYALRVGIEHLTSSPPETVVFIDADCRPSQGSVAQLALASQRAGRPMQAVYTLDSPRQDRLASISWMAMLFKNLVRPMGLARMGGPCPIMGTGFAAPWRLLVDLAVSGGNLVEDMQMGVDLALAGHPSVFCPSASVFSPMAPDRRAAASQRKRWEQGHLRTLLTQAPRLLSGAIRQRDPRLLLMALDLAVPPMSLLVIFWLVAITLAGSGFTFGIWGPAVLLAGFGGLLLLAVVAGWYRHARHVVSVSRLLAVPLYVAWKIPTYVMFLLRPQREWVRTERGVPEERVIDGVAVNATHHLTCALSPNKMTSPAEFHHRTGCQSDRVVIMGVAFDRVTQERCAEDVLNTLERGLGGWLVTANLDHLHRLVRDDSYAALCSRASLIVADGMPLVWAAWLQGTPLPERVAGSDLISSLSAAAAQRGRSIFLLGGSPGTAEAAARVLVARHPSLRVAGWHCPAIGFEKDPQAVTEIERILNEANPDIVYVALGSPKQEQLIARMRDVLPHAWWLGVGISFSFLCGDVRRAPRWLQAIGFEWLHRLIQEPRRLGRRYLIDDLPFAGRLFFTALCSRFRGSLGRATKAKPDQPGFGQSR